MRRVSSPSSDIPKTRASRGQSAGHGGGHPPQAAGEHARIYVATSQGAKSIGAFGALVRGLRVKEGAVRNSRLLSALLWEEGLAHITTDKQTKKKGVNNTFLKNFMYTTTPRPPKTIGERN